MPAKPVLQVAGLCKRYGSILAADDVSFEVQDGEIFGLIGPNGAGKTTTMECVEGVRTPSVGFLVASLVPTARFAQPIGSLLLYPMLGTSGLFLPIAALPAWLQPIAHVLPLTPAVSLLRGIWRGDSWLAHGWDVAGLAVVFGICTARSSKVFRWG